MENRVYDRTLFLQVIDTIKGIRALRTDTFDEISSQIYEGITGKMVMVDITDLTEDITYSEGVGYLTELGVEYLIPTLFPPVEESTREQTEALSEHNIIKDEALKGL